MAEMISIVVPVYNNKDSLAETCRQLIEVHGQHFSDMPLEILFVNDASKDDSWAELLRLKSLHPEIIVLINLSRNFGQLGALYAGFHHARGEAVICVSADLQDPISLMARMVAYWKDGTEIVICYREGRKDGVRRRLSSNLAYSFARLSYPELPVGGFDYWLMSKRVCGLLCSFKGRHNFLQGYLVHVGFSKAFIPYTRMERKFGKSGHKLAFKISVLIDFLVESSYLPIRAMSCLGAAFAFAGVIYSLLIVNAWFQDYTPFPGWAPLMIMLMIIGGVLMLMLGIIGEYIWRIHDNAKEFPLFIVAEKHDVRGSEFHLK